MILAELAGPTGNRWADLVIAIAGLVVALGVLWRKVVKPIVDGVSTLERAVPVLLTIASQFETNGGASLKDSLNRIETQMVSSAERQVTMGEKLDALHDYSHESNHRLTAAGKQLADTYGTITSKLDEVKAEQGRVATALGVRQQGGAGEPK